MWRWICKMQMQCLLSIHIQHKRKHGDTRGQGLSWRALIRMDYLFFFSYEQCGGSGRSWIQTCIFVLFTGEDTRSPSCHAPVELRDVSFSHRSHESIDYSLDYRVTWELLAICLLSIILFTYSLFNQVIPLEFRIWEHKLQPRHF